MMRLLPNVGFTSTTTSPATSTTACAYPSSEQALFAVVHSVHTSSTVSGYPGGGSLLFPLCAGVGGKGIVVYLLGNI